MGEAVVSASVPEELGDASALETDVAERVKVASVVGPITLPCDVAPADV
tara:strand:- start:666 stop:812 length:147 start_codon:yes stop_codon:yes gene_type:complete